MSYPLIDELGMSTKQTNRERIFLGLMNEWIFVVKDINSNLPFSHRA